MKNTFKCKFCGKENEISEALSDELKQQIIKQTQQQYQLEHQKDLQNVQKQAQQQMADLQNQIKEKDGYLQKMRDQELELRKQKRQIEEEKKEMALKVQREIDEKSASIEQKAYLKAKEEDKLNSLEKEKIIADLKKSLEEAQRKANQGSQQSQGEVFELDLEDRLRTTFINDEIIPVEKGVKGADIRQIVKSPRGFVCGSILWEVKQTKVWTEGWIEKLKSDLRSENANIAVIATSVMPKDISLPIGYKNGVWVTTFATVIILAQLLRKSLLDSGLEKAKSLHRGEQADRLYEYISGHEFSQQLQAMYETYMNMKIQVTKERNAFEKMWKEREKHIDQLLNSMSNIGGSISGHVKSFSIKGMDILELEDGINK